MMYCCSLVTSAGSPAFALASDLSLESYRVEPGSPLVGKTLSESGLRRESGATAVAIHRTDRGTLVNPAGDDVLAEGDIVLLLGKHEQISAACSLFRANAAAPTGEPGHARDHSR